MLLNKTSHLLSLVKIQGFAVIISSVYCAVLNETSHKKFTPMKIQDLGRNLCNNTVYDNNRIADFRINKNGGGFTFVIDENKK